MPMLSCKSSPSAPTADGDAMPCDLGARESSRPGIEQAPLSMGGEWQGPLSLPNDARWPPADGADVKLDRARRSLAASTVEKCARYLGARAARQISLPVPAHEPRRSAGLRQIEAWLKEALSTIDSDALFGRYISEEKEAAPDLWEPLSLERASPVAQAVEKQIDAAIETVRQDNGYAANHPGERQYVLDQLSMMPKRLKEQTGIACPDHH